MHARKSLLFNKGPTWMKKDSSKCDLAMGSFDGTEGCELVGLYILNELCEKYGRLNIRLYRDGGFAISSNILRPETDRIRKKSNECFQETLPHHHNPN